MCGISFFGWLICCCSKLNYSYTVAGGEMTETGETSEQRDGALIEKGLQILVSRFIILSDR